MLSFAPLDAAVSVASTVVQAVSAVLAPVAGANATALAIIVFTVAIRLIISPLTIAQIRGERSRAKLAPQLRELQREHAGDREALGRATIELYRAGGVSPLAGCLPALAQAPFFFLMYRLFTTTDGDSSLLGDTFLGAPLGSHVFDGLAALPLYAVLLALLGVLAWRSSRRISATMVTDVGPLNRVLPLLPYVTVLVAVFVPLAAVLYLATTTAWTALEHLVLRRPTSVPPAEPGPVTPVS